MPEESFGRLNRTAHKTSYTGVVLGILIILLVFIFAGLYIWSGMLQKNIDPIIPAEIVRPTAEENNEPESTNAEADVQILQTLSTSDEISAIQADLESTNLGTLDSDLTALEAVFQE